MSDEQLARRVAALLNGRTIATAESCTAGRVAESLAGVEGASDFLRGGVVAYQEGVKRDVLGISAESVLTAQAAEEMVIGVARLLDADVAVSTTGVAGNEPEEGTPPGTVHIGIKVHDAVASTTYQFHGSPAEVCDRARHQALLDLVCALDHSS